VLGGTDRQRLGLVCNSVVDADLTLGISRLERLSY
jgi:hypothetical protein